MIRIPIPPGLPLKEFLRLRSHADWYLREIARSRPVAAPKRPVGRPSRRLVIANTARID